MPSTLQPSIDIYIFVPSTPIFFILPLVLYYSILRVLQQANAPNEKQAKEVSTFPVLRAFPIPSFSKLIQCNSSFFDTSLLYTTVLANKDISNQKKQQQKQKRRRGLKRSIWKIHFEPSEVLTPYFKGAAAKPPVNLIDTFFDTPGLDLAKRKIFIVKREELTGDSSTKINFRVNCGKRYD